MFRGFLRVGLYVIIALLPLVLALIWGTRDRPFIWNTARGAALVGICLLALQPILAGRFKWITRPFGFDMVIRFHRNMAVLALALLLAHPVLMAFGGAGWRILFGGSALVWVGKLTLTLVLVNVLLSLYQTRLGLKFERWRFLHDLAGPAILALAFTHSWLIGTDLQLTALQASWVALPGAAVAAFGFHKFIRPRRLARHPYEVTGSKRKRPSLDGQAGAARGPHDLRLRPRPVSIHQVPARPGPSRGRASLDHLVEPLAKGLPQLDDQGARRLHRHDRRNPARGQGRRPRALRPVLPCLPSR